MELHPVTRASASDAVYDQLVASILAGEVAAGDALPSERALSETLGVSRPVVREALQRLSHAGLLRVRHGGATRVEDYRRTAGPELLGELLLGRSGELDLTVARSIIEVRADLGPAVAAAAARRRSDTDVVTLVAALEQLRGADELGARQAAALGLWDALVDASHNVVHRLLFNALRAAYEPVMDALAVVLRREVSDVDRHAAIVAAVRDRDPDLAREAAAALLATGTSAALDAIDALLDPADGEDDR